jgi:NTE family protein
MEKYNLGIVLSGGGARGIAHLGVLKALEEIGVKPDVISGTSAGAIVGSFYASGHKPEEILDIVLNTTLFSSLRPALGRGFLRMDRAELIYKKHLAPATFENLKTPLYISATNIINGEAVYFNEGDLILPIMAASSIKGHTT